MRIDTQNRLQRLNNAAVLLASSSEAAHVKAEVSLQICVYKNVLEQLEFEQEHTQKHANVVTPIDDFCSLAEKTFIQHKGMMQ